MKNKKKKKEQIKYFVIRGINHSGAYPPNDIIGITTDEEYAKRLQSVFCYYHEVKIIP